VSEDLPVLRTPRLTLCILGPQAAHRYVEYGRENEAFHAPWNPPLTDAHRDPAAVAAMRRQAVEHARAGTAFSFALLAGDGAGDAPILGTVTFGGVVRGVFQCATLGYTLDRRAQGFGYMTEALQTGVDFAFNTLHLHRIEAAYMPHNRRSAAVLRRLGFTVEGHAKAYLFVAGQWRDHVLTSLTNPLAAAPPGYEASSSARS